MPTKKDAQQTLNIGGIKSPGRTTRPGTTTFVIDVDTLEKLRDIAYWDRKKLKDVVRIFLQKEVAAYEKKHGEIKPRPKDDEQT